MHPLRSSVCDKVLETEIQSKNRTENIWLDGEFDINENTDRQGKLFVLFLARLPDPASNGVYLYIRFGLILEVVRYDYERRVGIIDGFVKRERLMIPAQAEERVYLESLLFKMQELEGDETKPNLLGPDPYRGLEQIVVTVI